MDNKLNLKQDVESQLELANQRNRQKIMEKMNNQQEFNNMNQQKALQEIMKEESYKNVLLIFYSDFPKNNLFVLVL